MRLRSKKQGKKNNKERWGGGGGKSSERERKIADHHYGHLCLYICEMGGEGKREREKDKIILRIKRTKIFMIAHDIQAKLSGKTKNKCAQSTSKHSSLIKSNQKESQSG
jgi:hypothetical protein